MARSTSVTVSLINRAVDPRYKVLSAKQFDVSKREYVIEVHRDLVRRSRLRACLGLDPYVKTAFGWDLVRSLQALQSTVGTRGVEAQVDPRNPRYLTLFVMNPMFKTGTKLKYIGASLPECVHKTLRAVTWHHELLHLQHM
jgi:hypothetical protein